MLTPDLPPPPPDLGDSVFARLLAEVVSGAYPSGSRLPAERELAASLGASRPTLREALNRLAAWGLVEVRRGSGAVVRPARDWSFEVLPAYLRSGPPGRDPAALSALVGDLLTLRRRLCVEVLALVAGRVKELGPARAHVASAWASRADGASFIREDFEAVRAVVEASGLLPALWLLSSLAGVYRELATELGALAEAPPDYLKSMGAVLDALEAGSGPQACQLLGAYLERHDRRLLRRLGIRA